MILFKNISYKNFLSSGDKPIEVNFLEESSTLVVGQNGSGKSTLLDSVSFALFGKAHRNINKPQLTNSINEKNCLVELELDVGGSEYKIIRGLKPHRFEIWKNGVMINQNSHNKEYQKHLEQNILKLNHKTFHQVVVLGSSSFVPFMQLPAASRREVIEDLLDINLFSKMNVLLKEKVSSLKLKIQERDQEERIVNTKIEAQEKYIRDFSKMTTDYISEKQGAVSLKNNEVKKLQKESNEISEKITALHPGLKSAKADWTKKSKKMTAFKSDFESQLKEMDKQLRFFDENNTCPTCEQEIDSTLKNKKIQHANTKTKELSSALDKILKMNSDHEKERESLEDKLNQIQEFQIKLQANNKNVVRIQSEISKLQSELEKPDDEGKDITTAKSELDGLLQEKQELTDKKHNLNIDFEYNSVVAEMLKDTGIKTKIIRQYLPVINKLVNEYLDIMDFYVHFNFNESFEESLRSRHRDDFSYESFSEGEKQRIDLSLLFTWRQVAKMQNSVSTNLLILDETFDSSLDQDGVENLIKILDTLGEETNIFVISHKGDMLDDKFDRKLEFTKQKNFSRIKV